MDTIQNFIDSPIKTLMQLNGGQLLALGLGVFILIKATPKIVGTLLGTSLRSTIGAVAGATNGILVGAGVKLPQRGEGARKPKPGEIWVLKEADPSRGFDPVVTLKTRLGKVYWSRPNANASVPGVDPEVFFTTVRQPLDA